MEITINTNTQIKIYHLPETDPATFRANANALARSLSMLDAPWVIEATKDADLIAHFVSDADNAVVLPNLRSIQAVRYAPHPQCWTHVRNPMLSSH